MNNSNETNMDDALLGKYLSGEATPEEAILVESWIAATPYNAAMFREISTAWARLANESPHQLPDREAFLEELNELRMERREERKIVRRSPRTAPRPTTWLTMAACLLLVCIGAWYFLRSVPGKEQLMVEPSLIVLEAQDELLNDTLPDGSTVVMSNHAKIEYLPTFPTKRRLRIEGESWFDVQHDSTKPFIILAGPIEVVVLGTSFNLKQSMDSVEVSLRSGRVRMRTQTQTDSILLQSGQKGVYDVQQRRFSVSASSPQHEPGYPRKYFDFKNATLGVIAAEIEKAYNIKIIFENKDLAACTMSSTFDNQSLDYVLKVIAATLNIQYKTKQKTVYFSGKSCT